MRFGYRRFKEDGADQHGLEDSMQSSPVIRVRMGEMSQQRRIITAPITTFSCFVCTLPGEDRSCARSFADRRTKRIASQIEPDGRQIARTCAHTRLGLQRWEFGWSDVARPACENVGVDQALHHNRRSQYPKSSGLSSSICIGAKWPYQQRSMATGTAIR